MPDEHCFSPIEFTGRHFCMNGHLLMSGYRSQWYYQLSSTRHRMSRMLAIVRFHMVSSIRHRLARSTRWNDWSNGSRFYHRRRMFPFYLLSEFFQFGRRFIVDGYRWRSLASPFWNTGRTDRLRRRRDIESGFVSSCRRDRRRSENIIGGRHARFGEYSADVTSSWFITSTAEIPWFHRGWSESARARCHQGSIIEWSGLK